MLDNNYEKKTKNVSSLTFQILKVNLISSAQIKKKNFQENFLKVFPLNIAHKFFPIYFTINKIKHSIIYYSLFKSFKNLRF